MNQLRPAKTGAKSQTDLDNTIMTPDAHPDRSAKITFELSGRLGKQIAMDAAKRDVTQRRILLEGLQALGYDVTEEDLIDRRGRPRKSESR